MKKYHFIVVGIGGTGTHFIKEFYRYLSGIYLDSSIKITLIDGDIIEEKNLERQAFFEDQIGSNKAFAMVEALIETFGELENVKLSFSDEYLQKGTLDKLIAGYEVPVIISCVDNVVARKVIEQYFIEYKREIYYLDSGNGLFNGQCIYAGKNKNGEIFSPSLSQRPGLVYEEDEGNDPLNPSCTETVEQRTQHILANLQAAIYLLNGVISLIEWNTIPEGIVLWDIKKFACVHIK